jgi:hypothetical protein
MALPATEKTWQFNVNQLIPSAGTMALDRRALMYAIKAALVGFAGTPWIVTGSSNGAGAGAMDGVDRWASEANVIWNSAGSNHSWIVLKQTGMDAGFELLIDCNGTSSQQHYATIKWAISGFTGGNATTAPTASASVTAINTTYWATDNSNVADTVLHVMMSDDGECTRLIATTYGYSYPTFVWFFERIKGPSAGWATPFIVYIPSPTTGSSKWRTDFVGGTARFAAKHGAIDMALFATSEGYLNDFYYGLAGTDRNLVKKPNQLSGEWSLFPMGVVSETTNAKGHHGSLYDAYACPRFFTGGGGNSICCLVSFPNDSSYAWVAMDQLLVPWDGTPPQIQL